MNKKVKTSALAVLALCTTIVSAGCSKNAVEPAQSVAPATSKPTAQQPPKTVKVVLPSARAEDEAFYKAEVKKFMDKNPDVKVDLQLNPSAQYNNAVQLMFATNEGPDVFFIVGGKAQWQLASDNGWIQPIDEYLTPEFKARYPQGTFDKDSWLRYKDKVIGVPLADPRYSKVRPLFYNVDILKQYGIDAPPKTYSEFKNMSAKITKEGKGQVYGTSIMGKDLGAFSATIAGFAVSNEGGVLQQEGDWPISLLTGQANAASMAPAVEIFRDLNAQKVLAPGWENWDPAQMHQQFAAGKVAMFVGAAWQAAEILKLKPDIKLGIAAAPVPDTGRKGFRDVPTPAEPKFVIGSGSKVKDAAWKLLDYFGSAEFQKSYFQSSKEMVVIPKAYDGIELDSVSKQVLQVMNETLRLAPHVSLKNADMDKLSKPIADGLPKPRIKDLGVKAIINNEDVKAVFSEYDKKVNQLIDAEMKKARDGGSKITIEDLKFPEWDPMKDFLRK
ncbi:ABC transporter substrate-binding protein [Paenibacillus qinlingensis]|uniref:ABC transporter substrate-binding protein n=1 Tax=Paenibacillus qinlingensis TaxID=1837343 RepID=UPI0015639206|nr:extracellular solute-binding protein [Paenibacillus qinlingensis]NQX60784.1 extracellular solute-binding protein [Paenibacillus qinlingensis]